MKPSVGRIVHYVSEGSPVRADGTQKYTKQCRAAVMTTVGGWVTTDVNEYDGRRTVTQEWNPTAVGAHVSNPTGEFFNQEVVYDPGYPGTEDPAMCDGLRHDGGTWHWPARTESSE